MIYYVLPDPSVHCSELTAPLFAIQYEFILCIKLRMVRMIGIDNSFQHVLCIQIRMLDTPAFGHLCAPRYDERTGFKICTLAHMQ